MDSISDRRGQVAGEFSGFLPAVVLLFIGSGCAALIYEVLWYQMLQLVIGLTTMSLGVLLGTFMGGMCLGSILLPRIISPRVHPLRVYAFLELGIGAIGIAILYLMPRIAEFYTEKYNPTGTNAMALRSGIAAICLLPPTLFMGATLPAIARWVKTTPRGVSWLGFFYGGNIAGAVVGCLLAGFYLLRTYDVFIATYAAAGLNLVVALIAFTLAAVSPHNEAIEDDEPMSRDRLGPFAAEERAPGAGWAYVTIALSGMTALGAEVVWTRLLGLILGGTVYTFAIILAVFLAGLGIGSTVAAMISRDSSNPRSLLGVAQLLLTAAIAWTAYSISHSLPYWPIDPAIARSPWYVFQIDMARVCWALLPASILWGASFPLALATVAGPGRDPGKLVGGVYAANTLGAIIGAMAFSVYFVPKMHAQDSQRILIGIAAFSALIMLAPLMVRPARALRDGRVRNSGLSPGGLLLVLGAAAATAFLVWSVGRAPWGLIAYGRQMATMKYLAPGVMKDEAAALNEQQNGPMNDYDKDNDGVLTLAEAPEEFKARFKELDWDGDGELNDSDFNGKTRAIYEGEGLNGSVVVTLDAYGTRSFHAAGKVQASNDPLDMKLQRMLGHISALAIPEPKSVLVVACGAGVTAGTFLLHPTITEIVICDIEELVPKYVTPHFTKENYGITDQAIEKYDPATHTSVYDITLENGTKKTVTVVYDDGRHYIRTLKRKFDIISSDPIDPWVKGQAALNTVEYYQMAKDHLNDNGVMSLWIPLYESKLETSKSVIGTFFTVFDKGIMWSNEDSRGQGYDAVLFGQPNGSVFDVDALQKRLEETPLVYDSLKDVGLPNAQALISRFAAYGPDAQAWMDEKPKAQINRDNDLRLQYLAGMALNSQESADILSDLLRFRKYPEGMITGSPETVARMRELITPGAMAPIQPE